MKLFTKKKKKEERTNSKIKKAKDIIKKEKQKIKEEKRKMKEEKYQKFSSSKFGKLLKKIFLINENSSNNSKSLKSQILSIVYFEIMGAVICLIILFILSGGKNYIKLYAELSKLIDVYNTITTDYYGDIDKEQLVDSAISSMVASVDDTFTNYSNESGTEEFMENIQGTYEGIGASVSVDENSNIYVVEVFEDGPAAEAGLKEKDIILKVDNKDFTGKSSDDVAQYIKNSEKNKVTLTISRNNKTKEIEITRKKIDTPTVTTKVIEEDNKKIGYISISIFTSITTEQFEKKLTALEKKDIQALIIDVRNNSGGYLTTATDITSLFLEKGQTIYQLSNSSGTTKIKDKTKEKRTYPIAVLINKESASASEILASAIKESYNGHIVGVNSYGKGTVQKTKQLSDGSMIKYTIEKWLTPKGNWINEKGVEPTEYVEYDITKNDNQLEQAVTTLIGDLNN